ncbi:thioesterase family protein [Pseudonocardia sp. ICBG1293]|uniref:thioesterase family protein n=1 Tax=Pseudonocardia sp. ICBG1293 TaxID=2844382 RepID=UPI001CC977D1|nr:hotdog domain-containing protein [Pseudonocardia sp. ICBG1293]
MVTATHTQPHRADHDLGRDSDHNTTHDTVSLFYVVPADQLVPDLHPRLGAFRSGEHVFATGYLVGLLEAPCLTYLRRRARAGQAPVGTRVKVEHRAPSIPGNRLHVTARCTVEDRSRFVFAVAARDQHGLLVADGHVTTHLVDTTTFRARLRHRARDRPHLTDTSR